MKLSRAAARLQDLTRPTGEEDVLNVRYPEPRFEVAPKHAVAVAAIVVTLLAGWLVVRPTPDQAPELPTAEWAAAGEETPVPESVVVSVVGEVERPGLVTLDQGSRVADALAVAGALPHADVTALNQAQLLVDGQQIHVLAEGEAPPAQAPGAAPSADGLISLNSAGASELMELDGVGEATAAAIIAYREEHGVFTSTEQLLEVSGIGPAKYARMKDSVSL